MLKHDQMAGFLAFTLAVSAAIIAPPAHADLLSDLGKDLKRVVHDATTGSVNQTIDAVTPASAKRAALGLPGDGSTVTDKVVGRVMRDASNYTYGNFGSARSAVTVPVLPGSGSLPGRGGTLGQSVSKSVSGVAREVTSDKIETVTETVIGNVLGAFDHDDSHSP